MSIELPKSIQEEDWSPVEVEGLRVGVISDLHIPYHDNAAIKLACSYLKDRGIDQLVILGDFVDFYSISRHDKTRPLNNDLSAEIDAGKQGLGWLREQFPNIPIKWKEGNHDDRVMRWVNSKVPELSNLAVLTMDSLFDLKQLGIEYIQPSNHLTIEDLYLVHGHEVLRSGGATPAIKLYKKTGVSTMCGHFHRSDEYWHRDITDKVHRCYTLGSLCTMSPEYLRLHNWNHGFAFIERSLATYHVQNKRIIDNEIL